ncbi:MAG: cell division/cell wall cluster transcriptional repressor MraZ [Gammaproteobacteria bacterium]|nr:division/cell wall cluster transcriptional repressor MraZ [Gammaproteobacteria bacterium]PCH62470.1 MAG: cell division/cell wall cluster transcriptional repressor MraZ [Gammaproteobacteria bacterium]
MFYGVTHINLDTKARLAMPTRYRSLLEQHCSSQVCITAAVNDRCLLVYPQPEWEKLSRKLSAMPTVFDDTARKVGRRLMGYAEERQLDGQGRILLTAGQKEYAGISKNIVLAGQGNKFEIWDEESWSAAEQESLSSDLSAIDPEKLPDYLKNL